MESTLSVIIPCYNGEKTLDRCLASLLAQSVSTWECILVDDGSTDGTAALLAAYAAKDPRFQTLRIQNSGTSRAKNLGLDKAQGSLLMFLDCDDYLEPHALELLQNTLEQTLADVAIGHLLYEDGTGAPLPNTPPLPVQSAGEKGKVQLLSIAQAAEIVFKGQPFAGHMHGKLIRRDKLQSLRFREDLSVYEDMLFLLTYLQGSKKAAYVPTLVHHYVFQAGGIMAAPLSQRKASSLAACEALERVVQQSFPFCANACHRFTVQNALWFLEEYLAAPPDIQQAGWALSARKEACRIIRDMAVPKGLPVVQRVFCMALKLGWPAFEWLYTGPYRQAKKNHQEK